MDLVEGIYHVHTTHENNPVATSKAIAFIDNIEQSLPFSQYIHLVVFSNISAAATVGSNVTLPIVVRRFVDNFVLMWIGDLNNLEQLVHMISAVAEVQYTLTLFYI